MISRRTRRSLAATLLLAGAPLFAPDPGTTRGSMAGGAPRSSGNLITVECGAATGTVNRNIFGNNLIAYDPSTYEGWGKDYAGYTDYGAGIWDPAGEKPVREVVALARDAGISVFRFPGGCGSHHYRWQDAIGPGRKKFRFGLDEFLRVCDDAGALPVMTVSFFENTPESAARLVRYLNRRSGGNAQRVRYFEIGNEVYHGDHRGNNAISAGAYAEKYLALYDAMKKVDPSIRIGAVLHTPSWNRKLLWHIRGRIDFGIIHLYPYPKVTVPGAGAGVHAGVFRLTLSEPSLAFERRLREALLLMERYARKRVPIAVTEYNGGFNQEKPVPYRHTLGTALVNAELLRILCKPSNRILMANYWQFCNSFFGMVRSEGDFMRHPYPAPIAYRKRPNYFVYELYRESFGEELLDATVRCGMEDIAPYYSLAQLLRDGIAGTRTPILSVNASRSRDGKRVYVMVLNKDMDHPVTALVELRGFAASGRARARILNGPRVESTNEEDPGEVGVVGSELKVSGRGIRFTFPAHSLCALEFERGK